LFGLRIDLHRVEASLERHCILAGCLDSDDRLTVMVAGPQDTGQVRRLAARASGLPPRAVRVHAVEALPRLANGKLNYHALRALTRDLDPADTGAPTPAAVDLAALFADILDRPDVTGDSTFVGLGGDSLSYVEVSVRLEQVLGHLPADWHTTPIRDLRPAPRPRAIRRAALDTGVALRAISIVLIVGTHAALFGIAGGAHLLLGVAGFNFARFHLTPGSRRERMLGLGTSIRRIVLASICWIALAAVLLADDYGPAKIFLIYNIVGPPGTFNQFWFIEAIIYMLLGVSALLAIPGVDRAERRYPFALPMVLVGLALITRYQLIPGVRLATPLAAFWLFALGWAAAKATTNRQRLLVTLATVATIPGFHHNLAREAVIAAGLILLTWIPTIPSLPLVNRIAGVLAAASLYIYLTHWQVYPRLDDTVPILAVAASLAAGIAYKAVTSRATAGFVHLLRRIQAARSTRAGVSRAAG
jgi:hypothetical protein